MRAVPPAAPDAALAPTLFSDELLLASRHAYLVAYLRSWSLDVPSTSTDWKAIEAFLVERYWLRSDDVAHADLFGWSS